MNSSSEMSLLVLFWLCFCALLMVAVIPFLVTITVGVIHWWRRAARERIEGIHTAAAQGSRAGEKLGAVTSGLIALVSVLVPGGVGFDVFSSLLLMFAVVPAGLWGMVSGSIAGQCSTRSGAVTVGALMFLLGSDPPALFLLITRPFGNAFHGVADVPPEFGFWTVALLHLSLGTVVGNAAFRIGQQRAAAMAASGNLPLCNVADATSPLITDSITPATQWQHLG